jgi:hypothetical protein
MLWAGFAMRSAILRRAGRRAGHSPAALLQHRSAQRPARLAHVSLVAGLAAGLILMQLHGWGFVYPRWLAAKSGLVLFLLLPLEGMHAWITHTWIARGLARSSAERFAKDLERGLGMEEMIRTLELVLLVPGLALLVWLSVRKPF